MKPRFLLTCLETIPDDILYVDADAEFLKVPDPDHFDCDLGIHYRNKCELLSGTIFLRNCSRTRRLIRMWCVEQAAHQTTWDQKVLQSVIQDHGKRIGVHIQDIGPNYVKIFDRMPEADDPVIIHNQASRKYRRIIK